MPCQPDAPPEHHGRQNDGGGEAPATEETPNAAPLHRRANHAGECGSDSRPAEEVGTTPAGNLTAKWRGELGDRARMIRHHYMAASSFAHASIRPPILFVFTLGTSGGPARFGTLDGTTPFVLTNVASLNQFFEGEAVGESYKQFKTDRPRHSYQSESLCVPLSHVISFRLVARHRQLGT